MKNGAMVGGSIGCGLSIIHKFISLFQFNKQYEKLNNQTINKLINVEFKNESKKLVTKLYSQIKNLDYLIVQNTLLGITIGAFAALTKFKLQKESEKQ